MIEHLDPTSRAALIEYRLQRSYETLKEADFNESGGYYNAAVNRLYYAAYYAASALMLAYGIDCSTHAGIKTMLSLKFVKPGLLDRVHGRTFMSLLESRHAGDYEDFVYCDQNLYELLKPKTEAFIEAIHTLIIGLTPNDHRACAQR